MESLAFERPHATSAATRIANRERPRPSPGEITIAVHAVGLNFIDVLARRGDAGYATHWPWTGGLEVSGTVLELGAGVSGFARGDRVAALTSGGGFAEVAVAAATLTVAVPHDLPFEAAATAPLGLATAVLLQDFARPGDTVLAHSASGGLGAALPRVLERRGAIAAIGVVGRAQKIDAARASGWRDVIERSDGWLERALALAPGGVDVVLDPVGLDLEAEVELLAPGGRLVTFGNAAGGELRMPPAGALIARNASAHGLSVRGLARSHPERVGAALSRALDLLASGDLDAPRTVVHGLAGIPPALDLLATSRGLGKYVAVLGDE